MNNCLISWRLAINNVILSLSMVQEINHIIKETNDYTIIREIVLPHSHLKLRSDGIVQITYPDHFDFTLKESIESVNAIGEITNGIPHVILKIPGKYTSVDHDCRDHVAKGDGARFSIAEAFIIKSLAHKILANFYIKVYKPQKSTHFFSDIPSAEKWLKTFI